MPNEITDAAARSAMATKALATPCAPASSKPTSARTNAAHEALRRPGRRGRDRSR